MKSISKKVLALLFIFLVISDDLVIQVKAKGDFVQILKTATLKQKTEKKMNISDSHKPSLLNNKNPLSNKLRRLKETEKRSLAETETKRSLAEAETKDFGLTFLIIVGIFIIASIVKYYLDKKIQKALKFLENEKNKLVTSKYYEDIWEGSLNAEYCLTLQSLSKLYKSRLIMEKIYEEDLKGSLQKIGQTSHLKPLSDTATQYLKALEESKFSSTMISECYNTYMNRQGWDQIPSSTKKDKEEKLAIFEDGAKATDDSIKGYVKDAARGTISEDTFEIAKKYQDVVENEEKIEKIWDQKVTLSQEDYFAGAGSLIENGKDFYDLYKEWKELRKEGIVVKIFSGISWVFRKLNNVLKATGHIMKFLGLDNSLNFPFLSIGASLANCIVKGRKALEAYKAYKKDPSDPELKLNKMLANCELVDEIFDFLENLVTTVLRFLTPLTAGFSEILNQSLKLLMKLIHIGVDIYKLVVINKLGEKIVEAYKKKLEVFKECSDIFRQELLNKQCASAFALVKSFLENEFLDIDNRLGNAERLLKKKQEEKLSKDEVNDKIITILRIICETDAENCLGILSSEEFNLDLETLSKIKTAEGKKLTSIAYTVSKASKYGQINSAFLLSKVFSIADHTDPDTKEFLQNYIPNSHRLLIQNGYYPIFQGQKGELWGCRICANPLYELDKITHGLSLIDIKSNYYEKNTIIQESVEGINPDTKSTSFFVAEYSIKDSLTYKDHVYNTILPKGIEDNMEALELFKVEDYENLQSHTNLATCTTKLSIGRSKALLNALKENQTPILSTIVHKGQKSNDSKDKTHNFLTFFFSYSLLPREGIKRN